MSTLVFIFIGIVIGAALVGAYLLGRERGRMRAIDDVARTMGERLLSKGGRSAKGGERAKVEMAVVGETETNADGSARQAIIAKLATGEDVELVRDGGSPRDPNAVKVVSRLGEIGRLARSDADNLAPYLDSGGRVSAAIAYIDGGNSTNTAFNVVISVVALDEG
jgi:hypothetical protein